MVVVRLADGDKPDHSSLFKHRLNSARLWLVGGCGKGSRLLTCDVRCRCSAKSPAGNFHLQRKGPKKIHTKKMDTQKACCWVPFFFIGRGGGVQTKMSWCSLLTVWYLRQLLGIKVQSCPVLQ